LPERKFNFVCMYVCMYVFLYLFIFLFRRRCQDGNSHIIARGGAGQVEVRLTGDKVFFFIMNIFLSLYHVYCILARAEAMRGMGAVYAVSRDQCEEWVQCMQYHGTNAKNGCSVCSITGPMRGILALVP
jgi:hypothetical protein